MSSFIQIYEEIRKYEEETLNFSQDLVQCCRDYHTKAKLIKLLVVTILLYKKLYTIKYITVQSGVQLRYLSVLSEFHLFTRYMY